jgi:ribosomal protein S18 acetylase RimI-like enzyme
MTKTTIATEIRRAGAADAATVARLGADTFAAAFGHMYPKEDLAAFLAEVHVEDKVAAEIADPDIGLWLAERGGRAAGYAVAGPCGLPHPEASPDEGELKRIYVEPGLQGEGVGRALIETALAWLERDGPRRLWISVWSGNHGAQRFYERQGFAKVGDYQFRVGATLDEEFILSRG